MANQTIVQKIAELEAELTSIKTAMTAAQSGIQSYTVGDLAVNKGSAIYRDLRSRRTEIEKSLQRLYRGGRGFVVDASQTDSNDTIEGAFYSTSGGTL